MLKDIALLLKLLLPLTPSQIGPGHAICPWYFSLNVEKFQQSTRARAHTHTHAHTVHGCGEYGLPCNVRVKASTTDVSLLRVGNSNNRSARLLLCAQNNDAKRFRVFKLVSFCSWWQYPCLYYPQKYALGQGQNSKTILYSSWSVRIVSWTKFKLMTYTACMNTPMGIYNHLEKFMT